MEKAFYRIPEAAEILGLGRSLTYRLVAEGRLKSVWVEGCRTRRIAATDLRAFIDAQRPEEQV